MCELHMRRTNRIVPTYTGDVSGACSALFELGGMVVIHDPSGCNSTYNTHDETRWYDHDSLIFITGLVERDAILGNDEKLIHDVVEAAGQLSPRFIALCNSPIPFISGTDFHAICKLIERQTGTPCFYVRTNGMHDYVVGAGNAFVQVAERFVVPAKVRPGTCNILGATPLDLGIAGSDEPLRVFAQRAGFDVISCWAMGSTLDELARAAQAQVNLVVSATGFAVAQHLRERYGTPYVVGFPVGEFADRLAQAMGEAARLNECQWPIRDLRVAAGEDNAYCVGEPVQMASLAACLQLDGVCSPSVLCPLEASQELLAPADQLVEGEEGVEEALARARLVLADGLYAPIIPTGARHIRLPHQALSGRNGWKTARDLCELDLGATL